MEGNKAWIGLVHPQHRRKDCTSTETCADKMFWLYDASQFVLESWHTTSYRRANTKGGCYRLTGSTGYIYNDYCDESFTVLCQFDCNDGNSCNLI